MKPTLNHFSTLAVIAGLSGAGRSSVLDTLSDLGFYALQNLPVSLLPEFIETARREPEKFQRTALVLDFDRSTKLATFLNLFKHDGGLPKELQLIYVDCRSEKILQRYGETRRPHPGFKPESDRMLQDTIQRERDLLLPFKEAASIRFDTSELTIHDLKREVKAFVDSLGPGLIKPVRVNFVSFGFKYGLPPDCDLVIDVRFLPNPYFVPELREKDGLNKEVADYVLKAENAAEFIKRYADLLNFLLPQYVFEGKSYLNIGVGCTGGKHRSVAIAGALRGLVSGNDYLVSVNHRDVTR